MRITMNQGVLDDILMNRFEQYGYHIQRTRRCILNGLLSLNATQNRCVLSMRIKRKLNM